MIERDATLREGELRLLLAWAAGDAAALVRPADIGPANMLAFSAKNGGVSMQLSGNAGGRGNVRPQGRSSA